MSAGERSESPLIRTVSQSSSKAPSPLKEEEEEEEEEEEDRPPSTKMSKVEKKTDQESAIENFAKMTAEM